MLKKKKKSLASWELFEHNIQIIRQGKKYCWTEMRPGVDQLSCAATSMRMRSQFNNTGSSTGSHSPCSADMISALWQGIMC